MMIQKYCILLLTIGACVATLPVSAQVSNFAEGKVVQKEFLQRLDALMAAAKDQVDAVKSLDKPRKVKRGAIPELILKNGRIFFDKKELKFGDGLSSWKKNIPGTPRCSGSGMTFCIWDDFGLEVGTGNANPKKVKFFNINLNIKDDHEDFMEIVYPNGRPGEKSLDLTPHRAFPGYLELNGFGIDTETKFWEIRGGSIENGKLHCGLLDCSNPSGHFGGRIKIYFTLDGGSENGTVKDIGLNVVGD